MCKISVIIPVYNVELYIERCLESIINQTYKNLEIILVNDGSTDKSGTICDEYALKDSRIRVIHQKNGGLSSARNRGLDIATGEYIGFVDSDDWISTDMYQTLLTIALKYEVDIVECGVQQVYCYKDFFYEDNIEINEDKIFLSNNIDALNEELKWGKFTAIACNKLYKSNLFSTHRYPIGKIHEDEYLTYKLLYSAVKLASIKDIKLYYYLQERQGAITSKFTEKNLDIYDAYKEKLIFFYSNNLQEVYKNMINNLLWIVFYLIYQSHLHGIKCKKIEDIYAEVRRNKALYYRYSKGWKYKLQLILLFYSKSSFIQYKRLEDIIRRILENDKIKAAN